MIRGMVVISNPQGAGFGGKGADSALSGRAGMTIRGEADADRCTATVPLWLLIRQAMPTQPQRQRGAVSSAAESGTPLTAAMAGREGGELT